MSLSVAVILTFLKHRGVCQNQFSAFWHALQEKGTRNRSNAQKVTSLANERASIQIKIDSYEIMPVNGDEKARKYGDGR